MVCGNPPDFEEWASSAGAARARQGLAKAFGFVVSFCRFGGVRAPPAPPMTLASLIRLFALAALWGGSFLFMRIAVPVLGAVPWPSGAWRWRRPG